MKPDLLFDFTVDKENKRIHVAREFAADLKLVWNAWITPELLEKWWAPKPWVVETKSMVFTEGGHWLYAMVSPEGEKHWSHVSYINIEDEKSFTAKDGFSDEHGTINPHFPQNVWEHHFSTNDGHTLVNIQLTFDSLEDLEKLIEMGFKEGFSMGLNQLDDLLVTYKKEKHEK
ncbi:MAG: SRPBCC domain-containing protein [Flavobacteriaceae bacterium]|nr:SRPBCC domain-containing protein [Flavobacteriaceae bacterium]